LKQSPAEVDALFERLMADTLEHWLALAEERLNGSDTICVLAPGNDDPPFVDDLLSRSERIINPEHRVVELPGGFSMVSCGTSNKTPWDTPREATEDELLDLIEREVAALPACDRAIFNLHVPPKDTLIDQAILLDDELRPVMENGSPVVGGVGSSAVRSAIERHQPMLSLHGHVHESRGEARLGRTLALNPGSEYGEGVLRGVIVTLSTKRGVRGHQFVAG
jgi:Icc-related predicted phosphoesterase